MTSYICPNCKFQNLPDRRICENCGIFLQRQALIIRPDDNLIIAGRQLPARQLKRIGASLAVSAVALIVEVGYIYLRRRLRHIEIPALFSRRRTKLPATLDTRSEKLEASGKRVVSVFREQVVEEHRWGRPVKRIISRMAWRSEESIES